MADFIRLSMQEFGRAMLVNPDTVSCFMPHPKGAVIFFARSAMEIKVAESVDDIAKLLKVEDA